MKALIRLRGCAGWSGHSLSAYAWGHFMHDITKTCLYNFDPIKPHFYIVKLWFTGVYIIFIISAQKHRLWYSLEAPQWGGSNEYPQSMFWAEIWKISDFLSENFQFLVVKFSIYLNRHIFVMTRSMLINWHQCRCYATDCILFQKHKHGI